MAVLFLWSERPVGMQTLPRKPSEDNRVSMGRGEMFAHLDEAGVPQCFVDWNSILEPVNRELRISWVVYGSGARVLDQKTLCPGINTEANVARILLIEYAEDRPQTPEEAEVMAFA